MGGSRGARQGQAQNVGAQAVQSDQANADQLKQQLSQRQDILGANLAPAQNQTFQTASNIAATGGINPDEAGYKTYSDMATTGGFTPEQESNFVRTATLGNQAIYNNQADQMNRNKALSGGYSPGFDASTAAQTRAAAESTGEAALGAESALHQQENANKLAGAQGQLAVKQAQQSGMIAGQDALQRYTAQGEASLNQNDITELQNRIQSGNISMADAQLLQKLAADSPSLLQQITGGIAGVVGAFA